MYMYVYTAHVCVCVCMYSHYAYITNRPSAVQKKQSQLQSIIDLFPPLQIMMSSVVSSVSRKWIRHLHT